jgi:predicted DNA binding CopG/RHH family protein
MPRTKLPKGSVSVTFRLPRQTQTRLAEKARREQMTFSQLIRRALHREIETGRVRNRSTERQA